MRKIGLVHHPKRKPNGITKADREARKSDNLLKQNFYAEKPLEKCVTDLTEIKTKDGKLYVSAIFDCFNSEVLGLVMDNNMQAGLCVRTLKSAVTAHPALRGAIVHSDRGSQYTSSAYREAVGEYKIQQSMNSDSGRCHDNARCESMWARMKCELFYDRLDPETMPMGDAKIPYLEILHDLLESPPNLLCQRWAPSSCQASTLLCCFKCCRLDLADF